MGIYTLAPLWVKHKTKLLLVISNNWKKVYWISIMFSFEYGSLLLSGFKIQGYVSLYVPNFWFHIKKNSLFLFGELFSILLDNTDHRHIFFRFSEVAVGGQFSSLLVTELSVSPLSWMRTSSTHGLIQNTSLLAPHTTHCSPFNTLFFNCPRWSEI